MSTATVAWTDPGNLLTCVSSSAEGDMIDELRSESGVILQAIDWVARKLGYDLIGAIFDPIAGDFSSVDRMRQTWQQVSAALEEVGGNYASMATTLPSQWSGEAADAARGTLEDFAEGHAIQAEAAGMMSEQLGHMLLAVQELCKLIANALAIVEEIVLSLSVAKWLKEIATGGSGVRRAIMFIDKAIDAIRMFNNVIPPMLKAAGIIAVMMRGLNLFMSLNNAGRQGEAGNRVDDTAGAGF